MTPTTWNLITNLIADGQRFRCLRKVAGQDPFKAWETSYAKEKKPCKKS